MVLTAMVLTGAGTRSPSPVGVGPSNSGGMAQTSTSPHPGPKVATSEGSEEEDWESFYAWFDHLAEHQNWTPEQCFDQLRKFTGIGCQICLAPPPGRSGRPTWLFVNTSGASVDVGILQAPARSNYEKLAKASGQRRTSLKRCDSLISHQDLPGN